MYLDRTLDTAEVAKILGTSTRNLHAMCRRGEGPESIFVGERRRFTVKAVEKFLGVDDEPSENEKGVA